MSLTLISGPAGSGKTGEVLDRLALALDREPILVVPTRRDVERFEEELLARLPVAVGARILTFDRLFELVASTAGAAWPQLLTPAQRHAVVIATVAEVPLGALAGPARRPGFAAALGDFIDEVRAARVAPAELTERLERIAQGRRRSGEHLRGLARLYEHYHAVLEELARGDRHHVAHAACGALEAEPSAWGGRPVFAYGFDDLAREQLDLLRALAADAPVTVSVAREGGRVALAARERLYEGLVAIPGSEVITMPPQEGRGLLSQLERSFLTDAPPAAQPDDGLVLLEAAGARNEVEQAGAEVLRLLRDGTPARDVAVILRSPSQWAGLIEQTFGTFGIPVAIEARMPIAHTALGRAVSALLRAALTTRAAADVVTYLRFPGRGGGAGAVDRLERDVLVERLESADDAAARWEEGGRSLWELTDVREAAERGTGVLAERVSRIARGLFERPLERTAPRLSPAERQDQLAAEALGAALDELAELEGSRLVASPAALVELVEGLEVPRHSGPTAGHVEVISPYGTRARRFAHVFVLGLQEGEFPRRRRDDPFLSSEDRARAGLPERAEQADEERYLFYACLSRPTRRLHLSYQSSDDEGAAAIRSLFIDDVLDLLPENTEDALKRRKGLAHSVFHPPASAPTERELARALAATAVPDSRLAGAPGAMTARLAPRLSRARARGEHLPGPMRVPRVLEELEERKLFGASSLELYAECPFRYLVGHELRPRELAPKADAMARGSAMHGVLEDLYRRHGRPTPETVEQLSAIARELLTEAVAGTALAPDRPAERAAHRRMESDLLRFLHHDAERPIGLEPLLLEASFGDQEGPEGAERPPLALEGFSLHGKIDRIDGVEGGEGLIRDYKSSREVPRRSHLQVKKKLQLPLYMIALRELWGIEPVGGVYHPLGNQEDQSPRGLLRGPREGGTLPGELFSGADFTSGPEEFEENLSEAAREAAVLAHGIQAGHLERKPLGGSCPQYCNFHPVCRRERGQKDPEQTGPAASGTTAE